MIELFIFFLPLSVCKTASDGKAWLHLLDSGTAETRVAPKAVVFKLVI